MPTKYNNLPLRNNSQLSRGNKAAPHQNNPKKLLYNNQSIGGTPEQSRRLAIPSPNQASAKRNNISKGKKGKKNSVQNTTKEQQHLPSI